MGHGSEATGALSLDSSMFPGIDIAAESHEAPGDARTRARRGARGRRDLRALRGRQADPEGDRRAPEPPWRAASPRHVDRARNVRGHWAASTVRAMLRNPVYTGRLVWNRLDFTEAKHAGGGARRRAREEWVIAEEAHLPLVSDEVYGAAQARFDKTVRSPASARPKRTYLFSGMVRCCAGHQPLSMQRHARARATTTTPAPMSRTTARRRRSRLTAARSGSTYARTGSSGS